MEFIDIKEGQQSLPREILHVLHSWETGGGTERVAAQQIEYTHGESPGTVLYFVNGVENRESERFTELSTKVRVPVLRWQSSFWNPGFFLGGYRQSLQNETIERRFRELLDHKKFAVVHFHSLLGQGTFELPVIAKQRGCLVVVSVTDYFFLCPDWRMQFGGKESCHESSAHELSARCEDCLPSRWRSLGHELPDTADYLKDRNQRAARALAAADKIVTSSPATQKKIGNVFGQSIGAKVMVIEPGVEPFPKTEKVLHKNFCIAHVGAFRQEKGADSFFKIAEGSERDVVFKVVGSVSPRYEEKIQALGMVSTGRYGISELPNLLSDVDLVLFLSTWDEVYCNTLSEVQACGVPVVALGQAAIRDRIQNGENGWSCADLTRVINLVSELRANPERLTKVRENLKAVSLPTREQNLRRHREIYWETAPSP